MKPKNRQKESIATEVKEWLIYGRVGGMGKKSIKRGYEGTFRKWLHMSKFIN